MEHQQIHETVKFLETCLDNFVNVGESRRKLKPSTEPEDQCVSTAAKRWEVDPDDPECIESCSNHWSCFYDTYVKLDHGILTVNQIDISKLPFELTYADDNNQFLYYNNAFTKIQTPCHSSTTLNQVAV